MGILYGDLQTPLVGKMGLLERQRYYGLLVVISTVVDVGKNRPLV
jgi:hypothetical protein